MKKCYGCGSENMGQLNVKGKTFPYKKADLILDKDFIVKRGCRDCGEFGLWYGECVKLDELLAPLYKDWESKQKVK